MATAALAFLSAVIGIVVLVLLPFGFISRIVASISRNVARISNSRPRRGHRIDGDRQTSWSGVGPPPLPPLPPRRHRRLHGGGGGQLSLPYVQEHDHDAQDAFGDAHASFGEDAVMIAVREDEDGLSVVAFAEDEYGLVPVMAFRMQDGDEPEDRPFRRPPARARPTRPRRGGGGGGGGRGSVSRGGGRQRHSRF